MANRIGEAIISWAFSQPEFNTLEACETNLRGTIEHRGGKEDFFKLRFKEGFLSYSPLGYAVKIGDVKSAEDIIGFMSSEEDRSELNSGSILFIYIACLGEEKQPNIDMLSLLLKQYDNLYDIVCFNSSYTVLDGALKHMRLYDKIHWDVIEAILKKGVRISNRYAGETAAFDILSTIYDNRIPFDRDLTGPEEMPFLCKLASYLTLEKKYHPDTKSGLSFKHFGYYIGNLKAAIKKAAMELSTSSFIGESLVNEKEVENEKLKKGQQLSEMLSIYHSCFVTLVKEGDFRDYFDKSDIKKILPALKKAYENLPTPNAAYYLFENWVSS